MFGQESCDLQVYLLAPYELVVHSPFFEIFFRVHIRKGCYIIASFKPTWTFELQLDVCFQFLSRGLFSSCCSYIDHRCLAGNHIIIE